MATPRADRTVLEMMNRFGTEVFWHELDEYNLNRDFLSLSPEEFGRMFTNFLKTGGNLNSVEPNVILIERDSECKDPVFEFLRAVGHRANRINFKEADKRLTAMYEVDISKVKLEAITYNDNESLLSGATLLARLKGTGHVRLDAYVLLSMMKNPLRIPKKWQVKCEAHRSCVILFGGTLLEDSYGHRYHLGLQRQDGKWEIGIYSLTCNWLNNQALFAVLPE